MGYDLRFKLILRAPRSEDPTEAAVLSQLGNPSETFEVTTNPSDARPYLAIPSGFGGRIDVPSRKVEASSQTLRILDRRTSGSADSLERWVTAFLGDSQGRNRLLGLRAEVYTRSSETASYVALYTGRVERTALGDSKLWFEISLRDMVEELESEIFVGPKHASLSYVRPTSYLPHGPVSTSYGKIPAVEPLVGVARSPDIIDLEKKEWKNGRTIVTKAFQRVISDPGVTEQFGTFPTGGIIITVARVHLRITSGARSGEEGEFWLAKTLRSSRGIPVATDLYAGDKNWRVKALGLLPLDPGMAGYLAPPAAGDQVELDVYRYGPPEADTPFLITGVHPATLTRDILDGKFGPLVEDPADGTPGDPLVTFPYLESEIAALEADPSFPSLRFLITGSEPARVFLEALNLQSQLGYRIDGEGQYRLRDWRLSETSVQGLLAIGVDDVAPGRDAVRWETTRESAVTRVEVAHYSDRLIAARELERMEGIPDVSPLRIESTLHTYVYLFGRYGDLSEKSLKIDARGLRFTEGETEADGASPERITRHIQALVASFRSPFGNGGSFLHLKCRWTANTNACFPGDLRRVQVPAQPDPATNLRGGPRLMRCIGRTVDAPFVRLVFLDEGSDAVALAPTVGAIAQNVGDLNTVDVPLTLNASSEPAVVAYAVTEVSVSVRPDERSGLWTYAGGRKTSGTHEIPRLPQGKRIWIRARTEVTEANEAKIPSAWAFPAAGFVDLTGLAAPTNVVATVSGRSITASCTVGDPDLPVMPVIAATPGTPADALIHPLPPGSSRFVFDELDVAMEYEVGFKHLDGFGGESAATTATATTAAGGENLLAPRRIQILQGRTSAAREASLPEGKSIGFGLEVQVVTAEPHAQTRIQASMDQFFATLEEELVLDPGPLKVPLILKRTEEETLRYVRARSERDGFADSDWSPVVSSLPTELLPEAGPDSFPGGWAYLTRLANGKLQYNLGSSDLDADGCYYRAVRNPGGGDLWPAPADFTEDDHFIPKSAFPSVGDLLDNQDPEPQPIVHGTDDVVFATFVFWNSDLGFGQAVYAVWPLEWTSLPRWIPTPGQTGSAGTLVLEVIDYGNVVTGVYTKPVSGPEGWDFADPTDGTWTLHAGEPYSDTVVLHPKHNSAIGIAVAFDRGSGTEWLGPTHIVYDRDFTPEGTGDGNVDALGNCSATLFGDNDVFSGKCVVSPDGTPDIATVRAANPIDGTLIKTGTIGIIKDNQIAYFAALLYTEAAGGGIESELITFEASKSREGIKVRNVSITPEPQWGHYLYFCEAKPGEDTRRFKFDLRWVWEGVETIRLFEKQVTPNSQFADYLGDVSPQLIWNDITSLSVTITPNDTAPGGGSGVDGSPTTFYPLIPSKSGAGVTVSDGTTEITARDFRPGKGMKLRVESDIPYLDSNVTVESATQPDPAEYSAGDFWWKP